MQIASRVSPRRLAGLQSRKLASSSKPQDTDILICHINRQPAPIARQTPAKPETDPFIFNSTTQNTAALFGRILLALIFITAGYSKIGGYDGTSAYMASHGVPGILLPLVILTELGGGLSILVGFQTRIVAIALIGFTLLSGALFHFVPADQGQMINFMKNLAIAGGFLALFANGAGAYSVDAMFGKRA